MDRSTHAPIHLRQLPNCRRTAAVLVLFVAMVLSACSNAEPPALTALGNPVDDSTSAASSTTPVGTDDIGGTDGRNSGGAGQASDDALAFSFEPDPLLEALKAMTKDDGVCVVFDAWFDASFSPSQPLSPGSGNDIAFIDDPTFAISTVDDGPFGEGWHTLITEQHDALLEGREANITAEQVIELDRLATGQCGYPVMTVLAVTDRQNCSTPDCVIAPDPRPALLDS